MLQAMPIVIIWITNKKLNHYSFCDL